MLEQAVTASPPRRRLVHAFPKWASPLLFIAMEGSAGSATSGAARVGTRAEFWAVHILDVIWVGLVAGTNVPPAITVRYLAMGRRRLTCLDLVVGGPVHLLRHLRSRRGKGI